MTSSRLSRRNFVRLAGTAGTAAAVAMPILADDGTAPLDPSGNDLAVPDTGWRLWIDREASWEKDEIHLPGEFDLKTLPVNPPSGGWNMLSQSSADAEITLPATVEQHFWGKFGLRPYTKDEYCYADSDDAPKNGAYRGVSWWYRKLDIPSAFRGRRIILSIRGARMRAEVYLNRKLVGYSIMEELPFDCDVTAAANPGGKNTLAIRITNPGGRYDWLDGDTIDWGNVRIYRSHGFGGLDRGMSLSAHPMSGRITDAWVLNRPQNKTVTAFVEIADDDASADPVSRGLSLRIADSVHGEPLNADIRPAGTKRKGDRIVCRFEISAPDAKVWDLSHPNLYRLEARWRAADGSESLRRTEFGFRWFAPDGIGKDAVFRLNGKRIKLYSAISWGYWSGNGLWPTPDLAEKEVRQAKALGLNCLNFHRNPGKEDVLRAQDRLGLLRHMEPGGGKFAQGRFPDGIRKDENSVVMLPPATDADRFCQRFMRAKCVAMVRAFRSHPSLILYCLQNETGADFSDPDTISVLKEMRDEDESRIILLNDGMSAPPKSAAQAWYAPYDAKIHRSDEEPFGGWWDDHQGAGDQWYDAFYRDPAHFNYRQPEKAAIVHYGEMEGCAVPDNHVLALAEIRQRGGASYDVRDRLELLDAYATFLDRWNFRKAFAATESLFLSLGQKCYESWQEYMENARINDATDFAVISGWESTAIDNHSGIVDNLRNFKGDPARIRASLLPVRPVAKQRRLVVARGAPAVFDLYLLNDTGADIAGELRFSMVTPSGREMRLGRYDAPKAKPDAFCTPVRTGLATPPLTEEGAYTFVLSFTGAPRNDHVREIWVCDASLPPVPERTLRVGLSGTLPSLRKQLEELPGIEIGDFASGRPCDVVVTSGLTAQSIAAQRIGGDEGLNLIKHNPAVKPVPGALTPAALAAVSSGTPLFVMAPQDALAEGLAAQLSAAGAFRYAGAVGKLRAPWMGNWYFVRTHPVYEGLPVDQAMGVYHQVHGRQAGGLLVDGDGVDVFVGYSRDHDRHIGAGTFTASLGKGKILFQRVPDLNGPMQMRFLRNALAWLCA